MNIFCIGMIENNANDNSFIYCWKSCRVLSKQSLHKCSKIWSFSNVTIYFFISYRIPDWKIRKKFLRSIWPITSSFLDIQEFSNFRTVNWIIAIFCGLFAYCCYDTSIIIVVKYNCYAVYKKQTMYSIEDRVAIVECFIANNLTTK